MPTKEELEAALKETRAELVKFQAWANALKNPPLIYATVAGLGSEPNTIMLCVQGNFLTVHCPQELGERAAIGSTMILHGESKAVVAMYPGRFPGHIAVAGRRLEPTIIELQNPLAGQGLASQAGNRTAFIQADWPCEVGSELLLDSSQNIVTAVLGKPETKKNIVEEFRSVSWDDIGGLEDVKQFFSEVLERPHLHPAIFMAYGVPIPKGALMCGPPGCGKTLVARAAMTDMASRHGGSASGGFLSVRGPELLSPFVGMTEIKIRDLFEQARKFKQANGFPAIIFFDEAESLMNRRGSGVSSDVDRTIVPTILTEMDGVKDSGALVLLATNRPEMIDPAILREGRIDRKVYVPRPNASACFKIFHINLRRYPISDRHSLQHLCEAATESFFSDDHALYEIHMQDNSKQTFTLSDVASGALVANIVEQAASMALNRDIELGKVTGIQAADVLMAIQNATAQHRLLDYDHEVNEHISGYKDDVVDFMKITG